jgi:hypothetical protein
LWLGLLIFISLAPFRLLCADVVMLPNLVQASHRQALGPFWLLIDLKRSRNSDDCSRLQTVTDCESLRQCQKRDQGGGLASPTAQSIPSWWLLPEGEPARFVLDQALPSKTGPRNRALPLK